MEQSFRLLIVDDQPRTRQSLSALLVIDFPQIQLSEASNGKETLHQVETLRPDVVVMDVRMPGGDGIEATRSIKARHPLTKVILYSMYAEYQSEALAAGADAFIVKGEPSGTLVTAIANLVKANPASGRIRRGE
jgi:DNA-binding NarL/FixJ family response regulator